MESSTGQPSQPATYQYSALPVLIPGADSSLKQACYGPGQGPDAVDTSKESYMASHPASDKQVHQPYSSATRQRSWTRWPFLLLFGLLIAIIAGLAGGFISKAIESHRHKDNNATTLPSPGDTTNSTTNSTASSQLVIPKTGCPDSGGRTFQTDVSKATYKLYCNVNWIGNDIAGIAASSISDCVEACETVNTYGEINKKCLGATFVPAWINKTLAQVRVQRPGNCFLKYNASGYPPNTAPEDIIVVCLEGKCPQGT